MTHSFPTRRSSYLFHGQRLGEALLRRVAVTTGVTSFRSRSSGESCSSSSAVQIQSSAITARELRPYDNRARPKATATQEWRARPAGRVDVLRTSGGRDKPPPVLVKAKGAARRDGHRLALHARCRS